MASFKRESDDDTDGPANKMARREDSGTEDDGPKSKSGRIRKKSAKVLEMEEFEEAEKKQFSKKTDTKIKSITPVANPLNSNKKIKVKSQTDETVLQASVQGFSSLSDETALSPDSLSLTPIKTTTKQATMSAKVRDGQGSVIKLLLSSPALPTTPSLSTNAVTKTSPPTCIATQSPPTTPSISISAVTKTSPPTCIATQSPPTTTLLHSKKIARIKMEPTIKQEPGFEAQEKPFVSVKVEAIESQAHHFVGTALNQEFGSPSIEFIKQESGSTKPSKDKSGSLKMKLMMSPKESTTYASIVPTSHPIPNLHTCQDKINVASDVPDGSTSKKKSKKKKSSAQSGILISKLQTAAEQMPNLAALVSSNQNRKVSSVKEESMVSISDGADTSFTDASLDMSSIVDTALDMEEEAALVIAEGATASKSKKKRSGGTSKKKSKAISDLHSFDSDDGHCAQPEGDIATLAAKVQRSSGSGGTKKKLSKKIFEQREDFSSSSQSKKKRPPRRAPTAYMLYCNAQRPKVVAESPGIDFAQISRTLGVMWQCLPKKEKMMWRRKSKKLAGKGSTLISTGKGAKKDITTASLNPPAALPQPSLRTPTSSKARSSTSSAGASASTGEDTPQSPIKGFGIEPIDIAAHLKLLGESLSIIGMRLQEHKGLIAVQGSLSVLLDSLLCACGPLVALTQQVPGLDGCSDATHARTLDSVAYIMPGL